MQQREAKVIILGKRFFPHKRLFGRRTDQGNSSPQPQTQKWGLRGALLRCSTLTEREVDEYIAYIESVVEVDVPLDYELTHPEETADVLCIYADGILQAKKLLRHTAQIAPETLEKVQRVLPLIYHS